MLTKTKPVGSLRQPSLITAAAAKNNAVVLSPASASEQEIPLSAIADSPWQRRAKTADDLKDVKTIATVGLLHAVTVRATAKGYELVCGHRRCAAARALGWKTIRARVCQVDDARAQEILMIENADREGLSAIEEAREYEDWLALHPTSTQTELAALMKVSQGHVANRLRMLKMPKPFQDAIISGEIPSTYSRAVLPFCEDERAAKAIEKVGTKLLKRKTGREQGLPISFDEFTRDLRWAFRQTGWELHGSERDPKSGHYISLPGKLSDAQRKDLDVVTVKVNDGGGQIAIATNKRLWLELARENHKREEARYSGRSVAQPKKAPAEMTAAEKKRAEDDHRRNQAKIQEQLRRRRKGLIVDRLRHLVALRLREAATTETELLEVTTMALSKRWLERISGWVADGIVQQGKADEPCKVRAGRLMAECLWNTKEKQPRQVVPESQVRDLARLLNIDAEAAWRIDQLGPLTTVYWNAHSKSDLCSQATAAGMQIKGEPKKGQVVAYLAAAKLAPPSGLSAGKKRAPKPR